MVLQRNDPCSCGSGKKYKKCCLAKDEAALARQKVEEKQQKEAAAEAARRDMEEKMAARGQDLASAPVKLNKKKDTVPWYIRAERELGWPHLPAESQQVVDAWQEEVETIYRERDEPLRTAQLMEHLLGFLDEHPQLFRYLHVHDEFIHNLGDALQRVDRAADYVALLLRLREEQADVYRQSFGYWDRDLLLEALRSGRREDIPACLVLFKQNPIQFIDQFSEVVEWLAWHGCEAELRGLLEPTAAEISDSPEVLNGNFGIRWLSNLAMFSFLERGDDSPEALDAMCQQVLAVGFLLDDQDGQDWLRRAMLMALPTEAAANLDLKQPHSDPFAVDVAWNYAGWLRRSKGLEWSTARLLADNLLDYWFWAEEHKIESKEHWKKGAKKSGKQRGAPTATDPLGPDLRYFRDFLKIYCRGFFGINTTMALPTIQSFHFFTQYLAARGHLNDTQASELQTMAATSFEDIRKGIGPDHPSFRIYPTYEKLISGQPVF